MSDVPVLQSVTEPAAATTISVTVRYFAAARAAVGVDDEQVQVPDPATVATVVDAITAAHGDALARVLTRCSYLLGGVAVHETSTPVSGGDEIDVLPPFAGG